MGDRAISEQGLAALRDRGETVAADRIAELEAESARLRAEVEALREICGEIENAAMRAREDVPKWWRNAG